MNRKTQKLQKLVTSAAWLCHIRCPNGIDKKAWDKAIDDLFDANQLIIKINNEVKL